MSRGSSRVQVLDTTRTFHHLRNDWHGDAGVAKLHYCDWTRSWTDTRLEVYGEIKVRNPGYLEQFESMRGRNALGRWWLAAWVALGGAQLLGCQEADCAGVRHRAVL